MGNSCCFPVLRDVTDIAPSVICRRSRLKMSRCRIAVMSAMFKAY